MTGLRLDNLSLQNFRCFTSCDVALHPHLTVLVAENGNGKTAVLDATSLALSAYVNSVSPTEPLKRLERTDVRLTQVAVNSMQAALPTRIVADGIVSDRPTHWATAVTTYGPKVRPSTREFKELRLAAERMRSGDALLPLVAFYGTGRLWSEHRLTQGRRQSMTSVTERLAGYQTA